MRPYHLALLIILLLSSCYEQQVACLDPDAANYNLEADEACGDCCTYPALSVRTSATWADTAVVLGSSYVDGAGNSFQIVRFRYYLGDLALVSNDLQLTPLRPVEVLLVGDTTNTVTIDGNFLLGSTATSTSTLGTLGVGETTLTGLAGTYGLGDRYRTVLPTGAPTGSVLRTQPGRLNFNDGRGYVQARLEYTLGLGGGDTLSVSSYGSVPFTLPFGEEIVPFRGFPITLSVRAELQDLLGGIDLSADSSSVAQELGADASFLQVTAFQQ